MDLTKIANSPIGDLVPIRGHDPRYREDYDHKAFVPRPLPSELDLTSATYAQVEEAAAALGRLHEAVAGMANPGLLVRPAIRREATSTSALEGTFVALTEVLEADFMEEKDLRGDLREVHNAVRATEYAVSWLKEERPVTVAFLTDLQAMLVRGTKNEGPDTGRIRSVQVFIGAQSRRVHEARFVPPPPGDQLKADVETLVSWAFTRQPMPLLVQTAAAHYQFETLHPFHDGNGRVGRIMAILQLIHAGALQQPVLNLSPWLEDRRDLYQDHLLVVSCTGDFNPWVRFFCEAVEAQSTDQLLRIQRLSALRQQLVDRVRAADIRGLAVNITEELVGYPFITPSAAATIHGKSYPAANTAIQKLVSLDILRERTGRNYNRIYSCDEVLRVIDS